MRNQFAFASLALVLCIAATALAARGTVAEAADKFAPLTGDFVALEPVNINGPYPDKAHTVDVGDLVLLQIRYPIVPPMPSDVAVSSQSVEHVTTSRTSGQVVILSRETPSGGGLGVGFVQVFVRGNKPGKDLVNVQIKRGDGSLKTVPFAFDVK
jgi:hypothetical protein